ncbi:MAG: phospholipid-binding domain-containing protein [Alphaproteobacteria bacterium CG_4_9_14_3_um_filter_47_13]|nr:MAG: phospholipid-binding domain-containing protein [Alphaproteobacteria bacterium CG_4_9_14_3_um_filter_47_13]
MSVLSTRMKSVRLLSVMGLVLAVVFCGALQVHASKGDLTTIAADLQRHDPTIVINQNTAEIVDVDGEIADIMVANPSIVDVTALQTNRLYIVGLTLGSTNLIAIDAAGNILKRLNIHVTVDTENIQRTVTELFPGEDVKVEALRGQIILSGSVSTPEVGQRVQSLLTHYISEIEGASRTGDEAVVNLMSVKGKSQVMLRVKILEVSRTLLKERGSDTTIGDLGDSLGENIDVSDRLGGLLGGVVETGVTETPFAAFGLLEKFGAFGPIDSVLTMLEEEGLAKILAEPNLSAISGEQASFLAGGEFPVPSGRDSEGNIVIQFRQFGVSLSFAPIVMSQDRISLQLTTEVSSLARDSAVTLADIQVPGLDVRRAATTVEMGSGATLMIAGLLQSQTINNLSGIPGMTRAPIIGQLMSSENFRRDETEMVVLVTPYLVEPYADKKQAKKISEREDRNSNELAAAFSRNIGRAFGNVKISGLFDGDQSYGYILE